MPRQEFKIVKFSTLFHDTNEYNKDLLLIERWNGIRRSSAVIEFEEHSRPNTLRSLAKTF